VRKTYQGMQSKSKRKFEVLGNRELLVEVPLPMVEVWEELQAQVEQLTGHAGLRIIGTILEDEVTRRVGPSHRPAPASSAVRWGRQPGYVVFGGQKVAIPRPRVRTRRRRSSVGQLRPTTTRRASAASGAGRYRLRADDAELSPCRGIGDGGLRDLEVEREPGIRAGQRRAIEGVVREKARRTGVGGAADRRDRHRQTSASGGAGH